MDTLVQYKGVEILREGEVILSSVEFELKRGEFVYLTGKVGTGKSTLLKTMYGEVPIHSGEARVLEYDLLQLKQRQVPFLRRKIGIVFQDFQLLTDRTIDQNLRFVLNATGWKDEVLIHTRIQQVLEQVGMMSKQFKMPNELSGGEQQRIVIARAILNSPEIILADEATGNLDIETSEQIYQLLKNIASGGTAVIMCTHNLSMISKHPSKTWICKGEKLYIFDEDLNN